MVWSCSRAATCAILGATVLQFSTYGSSSAQTFDTPEVAFGGVAGGDAMNAPYYEWVDTFGSEYPRFFFLPSAANSTKGIAVHWRVDDTRVHLAVAAKATGWVGLGLAENGGMRGADIVYFEAASPNNVTDSHVLSDRFPLVDDCQDWSLTRSFTAGGFLIFEANRLINTEDDQDRPFVYDAPESSVASRVIAAWGDSPVISYHGPTDRTRGQVRWFQGLDEVTSFADTMIDQAEGFFEHRAVDYQVGTNETQYVGFCMGREELLAQGVPLDAAKLNLIGFEPIIDPRAEPYVHHFVTTGSDGYSSSVDCSRQGTASQIYGWAPGEQAFALPDFLGLPFGDAESLTGLRMVIHYDNPTGVENIVDSSGVRYYYTTQPRQHEVGTMGFGDPLVRFEGEKVGSGLTKHVFECPSSCSSSVLDEPVTVIREYLHMHRTGVSGKIEQLRDGVSVRTGQVDFFDFDQQGNHVIQQPEYQVQPGDSFRLVCEFDASPNHVFGRGSDDEMCMSQLYYYPRKAFFGNLAWVCPYGVPLSSCQSSYEEERSLESEDELERIFGQSDGVCAATGGPSGENGGLGEPTDSPQSNADTEDKVEEEDEVDMEVGNPEENASEDESVNEEAKPMHVSAAGLSLPQKRLFLFLAFVCIRRKLGSKRLVVPLLVDSI